MMSSGALRYSDISLLLRDDTDLRGVQEFDDVANLLSFGNLITYLQGSIKDAHLAIEDKTIGVGYMLADALVDFPCLHHRVVWTGILNRVAARNDIGGNILGETGTSLQHS